MNDAWCGWLTLAGVVLGTLIGRGIALWQERRELRRSLRRMVGGL